MQHSTEDFLSRFRGVDSASLSDAMSGENTMDPMIKPIDPGMMLCGPAFTVKCAPGSILTVHKAMLEAPAGSVLVIEGENYQQGVFFGELMAKDAKLSGLAGIVIDGGIRDLHGICKMGFPSFAKYVSPRVAMNPRIGQTQIPVICGGIIVEPGDIIFGDYLGVVRLEANEWENILIRAEEIEEKERIKNRRMDNGERLADINEKRSLLMNS